MFDNKTILNKVIFYFTAILLLLPLVVWGGSAYPFIFPKAVWLQTLSPLILLAYIFLVSYNFKRYKPYFSWLALAVVLFYGAMVVSLFWSTSFYQSLWSRSERMLGVFQMLHYLALFLVWRSVFTIKDWFKLWQWFVGVGAIVTIVSFIQTISPQFLYNTGSNRVVGTLGNPIYVAGFCIFLLFSAAVFFYQTESKTAKFFWGAQIAFNFVAIFITKTRGDVIGLWAGLLFLSTALLLTKVTKEKPIFSRKAVKYFLFVLIILPLALYVLSSFSWVKNIPILDRLAISSLEESTGGTRLIMWKMAFNSWKQRPWFGWGWDNFYQAANQNYLPQLLRYGHGEEWTDNAHNIVMNLFATTGLFGLLAYLLIYGIFGWVLLKNYLKSESWSNKVLPLFLMSFLVAHFVQNLFVFENLSSYLCFFWILAGVDIAYRRQTDSRMGLSAVMVSGILYKVSMIFFEIFKFIILSVFCLATCLLLYRFTYIPAKADIINAQSIRLAFTDFKGAIELHRKAVGININPYRGDIAFEFGQFILVWMNGHQDFAFSKYRGLAMDMHSFGIKAVSAYLGNYPDDPRAWNILGFAYLDGYSFWQNPEYLKMAESSYFKSLKFSPERQTLIYGLVHVELAKNDLVTAKKYSELALNLNKNIAESHWIVALVCSYEGGQKCVYDETKEAIKLRYKLTQYELSVVFSAFKQNNDVAYIEPMIMSELSKVNGQNYNHQLFGDYIKYLKDNNRNGEAEVISKKLN
ncbi:MAG: O-antigen ligase family protein [Candidatus Magasanikbacteria bacterium]|nr:O-antigen ligase family protein [Candidatus Magasanikbacteria bacterium]